MKRRQKDGRKIIKILLVWLIFIGYLNFFPPASLLSFFGFYLLLSLSLFATFRLFILTPRSIIWTAIIVIYLLLRQNHLDNIINTILLLGIFVTLELYNRSSS